MFSHAEISKQLDVLAKDAERMEADNKIAAEHGRGNAMVDHIVALTRVVQQMHKMQKTGF